MSWSNRPNAPPNSQDLDPGLGGGSHIQLGVPGPTGVPGVLVVPGPTGVPGVLVVPGPTGVLAEGEGGGEREEQKQRPVTPEESKALSPLTSPR